MPRIRIELPESFLFVTSMDVRITDLNYGGHVGNDAILSLIHEARVRFLRHHGYTELDIGGVALIMGDAAIEYKAELFYGDRVRAAVEAGEWSRVGFTLFYKLEKTAGGKDLAVAAGDQSAAAIEDPAPAAFVTVAIARTGMICYDYARKKVVALPEGVGAELSRP